MQDTPHVASAKGRRERMAVLQDDALSLVPGRLPPQLDQRIDPRLSAEADERMVGELACDWPPHSLWDGSTGRTDACHEVRSVAECAAVLLGSCGS